MVPPGLHTELQPCMSAEILSYTLCIPSPTQAAGWGGHAATSVPRWLGKLFPQCLLFNWPGFTKKPQIPQHLRGNQAMYIHALSAWVCWHSHQRQISHPISVSVQK